MSKGTFYVMDTLSLKAGCSVDGDLRFKRLQVDLDAKINGNLKVLNEKEFDQIAQQKTPAKPAAPAQEKVENGTVGKE
jgi:cytoskeletal protein CcmA (bactofilin family)